MKRKSKMLLIVLSIALLLTAAVGGTMAYLTTKTAEVENTFTPSQVTCQIHETFSNGVKSDVYITNTGDIDAYIRAAIVVTWKNAVNGNVYGSAPILGADYEMTLNGTNWSEKNDFYYYSNKVAPGGDTAALIEMCQLKNGVTPPEGYGLNVEILAQAIQAEPTTAVTEAWGFVPGN